MNQIQYFAKSISVGIFQWIVVLAIAMIVVGAGYWGVSLLPSHVQHFLGQCLTALVVIAVGSRVVYVAYRFLRDQWYDAKRKAENDRREEARIGN